MFEHGLTKNNHPHINDKNKTKTKQKIPKCVMRPFLGPVVQMADNNILRINCYPAERVYTKRTALSTGHSNIASYAVLGRPNYRLTGDTTSSEIALSSSTLGDIFSNETHPIGKCGLSSNILRYSETKPAVCTRHMAASTLFCQKEAQQKKKEVIWYYQPG